MSLKRKMLPCQIKQTLVLEACFHALLHWVAALCLIMTATLQTEPAPWCQQWPTCCDRSLAPLSGGPQTADELAALLLFFEESVQLKLALVLHFESCQVAFRNNLVCLDASKLLFSWWIPNSCAHGKRFVWMFFSSCLFPLLLWNI